MLAVLVLSHTECFSAAKQNAQMDGKALHFFQLFWFFARWAYDNRSLLFFAVVANLALEKTPDVE